MTTNLTLIALLVISIIATPSIYAFAEKSDKTSENTVKDKINEIPATVKNLGNTERAESIVVRIQTEKELKFFTFSKLGFVKSKTVQFLLESLPTNDKKPFYNLVAKSLNHSPDARPFDVNIDLVAGDGSIIHTLNYKKCTIESYFVYVNDSKGDYRFSKDKTDRMEIRDVTKFDCMGFSITVQ